MLEELHKDIKRVQDLEQLPWPPCLLHRSLKEELERGQTPVARARQWLRRLHISVEFLPTFEYLMLRLSKGSKGIDLRFQKITFLSREISSALGEARKLFLAFQHHCLFYELHAYMFPKAQDLSSSFSNSEANREIWKVEILFWYLEWEDMFQKVHF